MAVLTLPSILRVRSNESHLDYSKQIRIDSDWSNEVTFLNRSYPRWVGLLEIEPEYEEEGIAVEAWLNGFDGMFNTALLPLKRPTLGPRAAASINGRSLVSGVLVHTFSGTLNSAASGNDPAIPAVPGMRVSIGGKVYSIRSIPSATTVVLDPQRPVANGVISAVTHIEARLSRPEHPDNPANIDWYGPWQVSWEEA